MALLFMDSFDHYVTADLLDKWTASGITSAGSSTITIAPAAGRRASGGLRLGLSGMPNNGVIYAHKTVVATDPTCVSGFAYGHGYAGANVNNGWAIAGIRDGAGPQISLCLNANNTLAVKRGDHQGTVLGNTAVALGAGIYTFVELKVLIHPSAGTVEVRFNGAAVLGPLTGLNTRATANSAWTTLVFGTQPALSFNVVGGGSGNMDYDDVYLLDGAGAAPWNTFLGDCRVDARYPTAAGATTGWTPSTGANWSCVDETAPNDDTDYTAAAAAGLTDTFVVQDAPVAGAAIYGVQHCLNAKKTDAGAASIAAVIRHGGVDYVGANQNPGTTYAELLAIAATNPGTAAAWTEAGFNAAEFGYKRTV